MSRLHALDLLRFIAAISVVFYHFINRPEATAFKWLAPVTQYGYLGVPIFFIISGYVIAVSATNRSAIGFVKARMIRLYPTYWIGLIFTLIFLISFGGHIVIEGSIFFVFLANLTMFNDLFGVSNLDGVYWTLHAELRFYGCVFLLMLLKVFDRFYIWLNIWLVMSIMHFFIDQPFFMGWFISPVYSPFFIAGVIFYLFQRDGMSLATLLMLLVTCLLSLVRAYEITPSFIVAASHYQGVMSAFIIFISFLFFLILTCRWVTIKKYPCITMLGTITYPLYLIHNVAGRIMIDQGKRFVSEELAVTVTVAIMIVLSFYIAQYIEPRATKIFKSSLILFERILNNFLSLQLFNK
ncbi:acyltransferase family protein [Marinagarivorans algicola]|uniref:acyltransferase family protein n=1 Tax=Marinagarivorans algicola TaxID=1513270 RepID=UPI0006B9805A|nr:acyltransferase [Marinagarivorans algicola]